MESLMCHCTMSETQVSATLEKHSIQEMGRQEPGRAYVGLPGLGMTEIVRFFQGEGLGGVVADTRTMRLMREGAARQARRSAA